MRVRFLSALALMFCCSISGAVEIPLDQIWATSMPGTKDIRELEKDSMGKLPLENEIRKNLPAGSWKSKAGPAFVVEGTGLEALKNAHAVFTGQSQRAASLPHGGQVSIVFFTLPSNNYVHLTHVERYQNTILIKYEFVPKSEENLPRHIALIPLGQLPKGQYKVDIVDEPFDERFIGRFREIPDERKLPRVSSSFHISIY